MPMSVVIPVAVSLTAVIAIMIPIAVSIAAIVVVPPSIPVPIPIAISIAVPVVPTGGKAHVDVPANVGARGGDAYGSQRHRGNAEGGDMAQ